MAHHNTMSQPTMKLQLSMTNGIERKLYIGRGVNLSEITYNAYKYFNRVHGNLAGAFFVQKHGGVKVLSLR